MNRHCLPTAITRRAVRLSLAGTPRANTPPLRGRIDAGRVKTPQSAHPGFRIDSGRGGASTVSG
jgi:hypothetical protein